MRTRTSMVLACVGGLASGACGQFQTQGTITYTLSSLIYGSGPGANWTAPVPGGNGDLFVDPGEGVLFKVTIGMSRRPGVATQSESGFGDPLTWDPSVQAGSSGAGHNCGFWSGDLSLIGQADAGDAAGTWSDGSTNFAVSVRRRLSVATAGITGYVNSNGSGLTDIQPAQFGGDADVLNHSNNFVTFQGLWIPSNYSFRHLVFSLSQGPLGIPSSVFAGDQNYDNGYILPVALTCATAYAGTQTFALVPGPAGAALLVGAGVVAVSRRRRRADPC